MLRTAGRGLLLNPWFAAGTGFVIAVGLWMYSPRTELRFPTAIGNETQQCGHPGEPSCGQSVPGGGSLAGSSQQPIQSRQQASTGARRSAASGVKFDFTVQWHRGGMFEALITVTSKHSIGSWQLSFTMPGDQIKEVLGAQWAASKAGDGGTASAQKIPDFGGRQDGSQTGQGGGDGRQNYQPGNGDQFSFDVLGTGDPATPTGCSYNGSACSFR